MKIDLSKFSDKNDPREFCRAPSRLRDGRVVAGDGVALACVDSFDGDASTLRAAPEWLASTACKLLAAHEKANRWLPVSSLSMPATEPCGGCNGMGHVVQEDCADCDGVGEFEHGRYTYDCKECDGDGKKRTKPCAADDPEGKPCEKCSGSGHKPAGVSVPGLPSHLAVNIAYLSKFPADAEISAVTYGGYSGYILALRGDGWIGVLMPMVVS